MLGIQDHPSSHSSLSLVIYGSLSSPQHVNTDWPIFFFIICRTIDACWRKPQGFTFLFIYLILENRSWSISQYNLSTKKNQSLTGDKKNCLSVPDSKRGLYQSDCDSELVFLCVYVINILPYGKIECFVEM